MGREERSIISPDVPRQQTVSDFLSGLSQDTWFVMTNRPASPRQGQDVEGEQRPIRVSRVVLTEIAEADPSLPIQTALDVLSKAAQCSLDRTDNEGKPLVHGGRLRTGVGTIRFLVLNKVLTPSGQFEVGITPFPTPAKN